MSNNAASSNDEINLSELFSIVWEVNSITVSGGNIIIKK